MVELTIPQFSITYTRDALSANQKPGTDYFAKFSGRLAVTPE